jgi:integrase
MLPTPANIKYANRLIVEIRARIQAGAFRMADYFPEAEVAAPAQESAQESAIEHAPTKAPKTIKAAKPTQVRVASSEASSFTPAPAPKRRATKRPPELTVEGWLTQWLGMTGIETSTRIGYDALDTLAIRLPQLPDGRDATERTQALARPHRHRSPPRTFWQDH